MGKLSKEALELSELGLTMSVESINSYNPYCYILEECKM